MSSNTLEHVLEVVDEQSARSCQVWRNAEKLGEEPRGD